jgi:hypothetical protein
MTLRPVLALLEILAGAIVLFARPENLLFLGLYIGTTAPMTLFCGYAAWLLWKRDRSAPGITSRYLWMYLAYSVLLMLSAETVQSERSGLAELIGGLKSQGRWGICYAIVWLRYFAVSLRVANTFSVVEESGNPERV